MAGLVVSSTVTVTVVVAELLHSSVTVRVTVLAPRWLQSNAVWLAARLTMPQPSEDRLSMSAATMDPLPMASSVTVWSLPAAVGLVVSSMVNVAEVLEALPHTSVAVKTMVMDPVAPQSSEKSITSPSLVVER